MQSQTLVCALGLFLKVDRRTRILVMSQAVVIFGASHFISFVDVVQIYA